MFILNFEDCQKLRENVNIVRKTWQWICGTFIMSIAQRIREIMGEI